MAGGHLQKKLLETQGVPFGLEGAGTPRGQRIVFRRLQRLLRTLSGMYISTLVSNIKCYII